MNTTNVLGSCLSEYGIMYTSVQSCIRLSQVCKDWYSIFQRNKAFQELSFFQILFTPIFKRFVADLRTTDTIELPRKEQPLFLKNVDIVVDSYFEVRPRVIVQCPILRSKVLEMTVNEALNINTPHFLAFKNLKECIVTNNLLPINNENPIVNISLHTWRIFLRSLFIAMVIGVIYISVLLKMALHD